MLPVAKSYFDVVGASQDEGLSCQDPSLAVQASKDECDINVIVRRYLRTGVLPEQRMGLYADISEMGGLQDALHMVADANAAFMDLPAEVRRYFDNDPVKLVQFAADPANKSKAIELGLAAAPALPNPAPDAPPGVFPGPQAGKGPAGAIGAGSSPSGTSTPGVGVPTPST